MARPITPEEYVLIKDALAEGKNHRQVAEQFERSPETIRRVRNSASYEEHLDNQRAFFQQRVEQAKTTALTEPDDLIAQLRKEQAAIFQQFEDIINTLQRIRG